MKPIVYLFAFVIVFASCKSSSALKNKTERKENKEMEQLADNIINLASENLGVRYKAVGTTKHGFDCSGLVFSTFSKYDISLSRSSREQSKQGTVIGKDLNQAKKGDLIFFKTNSSQQINHVGIVVERNQNDVRFIHTSTSKGVIISSTKEPYYQKTFVQLNRILH